MFIYKLCQFLLSLLPFHSFEFHQQSHNANRSFIYKHKTTSLVFVLLHAWETVANFQTMHTNTCKEREKGDGKGKAEIKIFSLWFTSAVLHVKVLSTSLPFSSFAAPFFQSLSIGNRWSRRHPQGASALTFVHIKMYKYLHELSNKSFIKHTHTRT